jgi:hypothetical protein
VCHGSVCCVLCVRVRIGVLRLRLFLTKGVRVRVRVGVVQSSSRTIHMTFTDLIVALARTIVGAGMEDLSYSTCSRNLFGLLLLIVPPIHTKRIEGCLKLKVEQI